MNLLNIVVALPAIGFLLTLMVPRDKPQAVRVIALMFSFLTFVASLGLAIGFRSDAPGAQFATDVIWIPLPEIHYHVGIDGLSLWLVLLSTLLMPICVLISWRFIEKRVKEFYAFLLLLSFGLVANLAAQMTFAAALHEIAADVGIVGGLVVAAVDQPINAVRHAREQEDGQHADQQEAPLSLHFLRVVHIAHCIATCTSNPPPRARIRLMESASSREWSSARSRRCSRTCVSTVSTWSRLPMPAL